MTTEEFEQDLNGIRHYLHNFSKKDQNGVRIHVVDVRDELCAPQFLSPSKAQNGDPISEIFFGLFLYSFKYKYYRKTLVDSLMSLYLEPLEVKLVEYTDEGFVRKENNLLMKQINKTGELKERIINIANKSLHEIWTEFNKLKKEFLNMEIDNDLPVDSSDPLYIRSFNILNDICETLMYFWNWANDIYALARMCKTYISR